MSSCTWLDSLPPACDVLRSYQLALIDRVADRLRSGARRLLVQSATGSGKTHLIAAITLAASTAGRRVVILATRTRVVRQLHERVTAFACDHGVIAAALPELVDLFQPTQICAVDTLHRRAIVDRRAPLPPADVVIFDEAHLALGASRLELLEHYGNAMLLGFSATPAKTSGRGLGELFDELIAGPSIRELVDCGALVRTRIFNTPTISAVELDTIPTDSKSGDFVTSEIGALMSRPRIVGDVVTNWLRLAAGKRSLVFACDKAHAAYLVGQFLHAGVPAELLTDQDDDDAREAAIARLERGETLVLANCSLLSYGIDIPSVEAVVLARPTRSVVLYLQAVGRGMRPAPGKRELLLLDHGRVVEALGVPTREFAWSLNRSHNINRVSRVEHKRRSTIETPRTCPECSHCWLVSEDGHACWQCSWQPVPTPRAVRVDEAELREHSAPSAPTTSAEIRRFFCEACHWYARRWPHRWHERASRGRWWAWSQTCRKFELRAPQPMPREFWSLEPIEASPATAGWLKASIIRYAHRRTSGGSRAARR